MRVLLFIFFTIILQSLFAFDNQVQKCGNYRVEGRLKQIDGQYRLLLSEGAESEVKLFLGDRILEEANVNVDRNVLVDVFFMEKCRYSCRGELIDFISVISPFDDPKAFRPIKALIGERECLF